jgi:hypothetical protein
MLALLTSALILVVQSPKVPPTAKTPPKKAAAVVVAPAPPPPPVVSPIDPGTVQSIDAVEVKDDPGCPDLLDRDRRFCGSGRRFELRRAERERAHEGAARRHRELPLQDHRRPRLHRHCGAGRRRVLPRPGPRARALTSALPHSADGQEMSAATTTTPQERQRQRPRRRRRR